MASRNPITMESLKHWMLLSGGVALRAAEELNKATSAVSYTVQKLEEQLDISLFRARGALCLLQLVTDSG